MSRHECHEVERIASLDSLTEDDRNHLSSCETCRAYRLVDRSLGEMSAASLALRRMPAADVVFVRAKILEKRRIAKEIEKPLHTFQKIANLVLVLAWAAFIAVQWGPFSSWLSGLELSPAAGIESSGSLPLSFFWMFAALSLMTMMSMLHGLSEEVAV